MPTWDDLKRLLREARKQRDLSRRRRELEAARRPEPEPDPAGEALMRAVAEADHEAILALIESGRLEPGQLRVALGAFEQPGTPRDLRLSALAAGLLRADPNLQLAALRLAHGFGPEVLPWITPLLDRSLRGWGGDDWSRVSGLAREVARVLADLEDPGARPSLIRLLDAPSNTVRAEALRGLGAIGEPADLALVEPFTTRPFPEVSRAAELAMARIQQRIDPNAVGALTLADAAPTGGLSLVDDASGALSLSDESE